MDPTATTGQGGRPWKQVQWSSSGVSTDARNLTSFMNKQFQSTNNLVTIPKKYLSPDTYIISLKLMNFLDQISVATVKVLVDVIPGIPSLTIAGPKVVSVNRPQVASLFAVATLPACAQNGSSSSALVYTWKLYDGITFLPNLKSVSLDARFFKLPAYSLDILKSYTVAVSVAISSAPTVVLTSATATLQVGQSGVQAVILGGALRTVGFTDQVVVDASKSYDIDYPTAALNYTWLCSELSPNYGSSCAPLPTSNSISKLSVTGGNLISSTETISASTSLLIQVFTTNRFQSTSSASVTLVILQAQIPTVSVGAIKTKYAADQNIVLSGTVTGIHNTLISWSSITSTIALSKISLTPVSTSVAAATTVFQLAIAANSLTPGLSYTFQLAAMYVSVSASANSNVYVPNAANTLMLADSSSTTAASYSQVTIAINTPPKGGVLNCNPSNGTALDTLFYLYTSQWFDSPDDYPLSYVLAYYVVSSANQIVIKNTDQTTYTTTRLGKGLDSNNFFVTCLAFAMDVYGGMGNTSLPVQVVAPKSSSALASIATSAMASALSSNNPGAVSQLIGAVTSTMNSVNCSVPVECDSINRQVCSFTARTCGPCLSGYIGVYGDSNSPCGLASSLKQIGERCSSDSSCISNLCSAGVCSLAQKSCPNDCAGNGKCLYFDANNLATAFCAATDSFCKATCSCDSGFFGMDCSLSPSALAAAMQTRQTLCVGLFRTLGIQDVSSDVITSRASSISSILLDITQITDAALGNCTAALVQTINSYPAVAGAGTTAGLCAQALSNVLEKGAGLPKELLAGVSSALTALTAGVQSNMAIGQQPLTMNTQNARVAASLVDSTGLASQQFSPPQSDVEAFQNTPKTAINFNMSSASSSDGGVGVAVVQVTKLTYF